MMRTPAFNTVRRVSLRDSSVVLVKFLR